MDTNTTYFYKDLNMQKNKLFLIGLASLIASHSANAAYKVIDFDTNSSGGNIVNGQIIDNEYLQNYGVSISSCNYDNQKSASQINLGSCNSAGDVADRQVAFNTSLSHTRDPDLEFHNKNNDYKSQYTALNIGSYNGADKPGNILILQENSIGCGDGVCNYPDDEGQRPAGYFEFTFDSLVDIVSLDFFDIEDSNTNGAANQISFYEGNTLKSFGYVPDMHDGNMERVSYNATGINRLIVNIPGSGGIDNLVFRTGTVDVPAPAGLSVLLLGLIALSFRKIKG